MTGEMIPTLSFGIRMRHSPADGGKEVRKRPKVIPTRVVGIPLLPIVWGHAASGRDSLDVRTPRRA